MLRNADQRQIIGEAQRGHRRIGQLEWSMEENMRSTSDVEDLEKLFDAEIEDLRQDVCDQTKAISDIVMSKYPCSWDPNYHSKVRYFQALCQFAYAEITYLENNFDNTFYRLNNLLRRLTAWLRNRAKRTYKRMKSFFRNAFDTLAKWIF